MNNKKKIMVGILILVFVSNIGLGIAPSIANIGNSFPEISRSTLQSILSIAAFSSFIASIVAGKLQSYFSQKAVMLLGALLMCLGILPIFFHTSFFFLQIISCFIGLGSGTMTATGPALISLYFEGEERSSMLGKKTGFQGLGNMIMTSVGGVLAIYGWRYNYGIFFVVIVGFVIGLLLLPKKQTVLTKDSKNKTVGNSNSSDDKKLKLTNLYPILLMVLGASLTIMSSCVNNNIALHSEINCIGDTSLSGFSLSAYSLGTIAGGLLISLTTKYFKNNILIVGFLFMALGQFMIAAIHQPIALIIGCFCVGFCIGTVMTRILYLMTSLVKSTSIPMGSSVFSAVTSLGFSLSPFIFNNIAKLFSENLATTSFFIAFSLAVICIFVLFVSQFEKRIVKKII